MTKVKKLEKNGIPYPENIPLKSALRRGDLRLIAKASGKSEELILRIFRGERRLKPEVRRVYDVVAAMNADLAAALSNKKPNV